LPMDSELVSQPETDEDVLTFDVPDAALERAASAEGRAFNFGILHSPARAVLSRLVPLQ